MTTEAFDQFLIALTGWQPMRWQARLYERFAAAQVPGECCLPTGLGKTSVIPIWLIAVASGARLPRRLVYIVNRRTVVDQATYEAKRLLARLYRSGQRDGLKWATEEAVRELGLESEPSVPDDHASATKRLRTNLDALSTGDPATCGQSVPLAVSTLRGELADKEEWKKNPARPAIIIGTIDMIGSKLLFSGYGDGRYGRAHHAGLIGQDALIVHDETHLEPAFDGLLRNIAAEQARCCESRPIRVMSLSATTRGGGAESNGGTNVGPAFSMEDEDRLDHVVSQRLGARKSLTIIDADKGEVARRIAEEALRLGASPSRVLVYVRSPDAVVKIAEAIEKRLGDGGGTRVARLTGTIRGKERDELAESEVFRAFKAGADRSSPLSHALYLVSTSAGEVGADLDADHLVCDLSTLDSMAQRFGRVNRLGSDARQAQIVVVVENAAKGRVSGKEGGSEGEDSQDKKGTTARTANKYEAAVFKTGEMLRGIARDGGDVSPGALGTFLQKLSDDDKKNAFSPEPTILPATDILFDHWSLTSVTGEMPSRPEVGQYLHGVAEWEPPETHVAWRADIALLATAGGRNDRGEVIPCSIADLEGVFEAFPLRSVEQLRDRTDRVQAELQKIAARRHKEAERTASSVPAVESDPQEPSGANGEDEDGDDAAKKQGKPINPNPWVVLMRGGSVEWVRLEDIAPADKDEAKRAQRRLAFATVVLPVEAGGLKGGMLDGAAAPPLDAKTLDVAEGAVGGALDRRRVLVTGDDESGSPLLADAPAEPQNRFMPPYTVKIAGVHDDESDSTFIKYRVAKGQNRGSGERVGLSAHNDAVAAAAERMAKALGLDDAVVKAVSLAGRLHDLGKDRAIWQRYAKNPPHGDNPGGPIAKSDRYGHWKELNGYRHEFGSLHDASTKGDIRSLEPDTRDLVLHLIAAHHGWGRPHFEPRHFDPDASTLKNEQATIEAMQRFTRLQQRYGRWGLAWLESILRCADAEASEDGLDRTGDPPVVSAADHGTDAGNAGAGLTAPGGAA